MKLLVLLLSDIHISTDSDEVFKRVKAISATTFHAAREAQICVIAVTGDITYSGSMEQFALAKSLLNTIRDELVSEGCPRVEIITVPGNHDCELKPENLARTRIIESINLHPEDAEDISIVETCTQAQENYFVFKKEITSLVPKYDDRLWTEYEFDVGGHQVGFSALNVSWMSLLKEKPGTLVFPIQKYMRILQEPVHTRFVLMHHPINWYVQGTYHPLRTAIRTHAAAILSGHEHCPASGLIKDSDAGLSLFFEAPALQPHERTVAPGFVTLEVDFVSMQIAETRLRFSGLSKVEVTSSNVLSIDTETKSIGELRGLTRDFEDRLHEPGADFKLSQKTKISIDDFYVFPELQPLDNSDAGYSVVDSEELIEGDPNGRRLLLLGEQCAGKTTLLLQAYKSYKSRGYSPVYLRSGDLKGQSDSEIIKFVEQAIKNQYSNPSEVKGESKERLVALLDDVERIKGGGRGAHKLISYLTTHYGGVILTAVSGFEFSELVYKEAWEATKDFDSYEIAPFGTWLKHRLIRKWCLCGTVSTIQDFESKIHSVEQTLDTILGKNLVPRVPIYILILLQSIEQNQQDVLTNSHIGSYYAFMIDRSLSDAGVLPSKLIEIKGYLSELAWFYKDAGLKECAMEQLVQFNKLYTDVQNTVDLSIRLELLVKARMLTKRDDYYSFTYPYIYYYFVGKYIAKNLATDGNLQAQVSSWCAALHRQDNANCILFIVHHVNDASVINRVTEELDKCFENQPPLCFGNDVDALNALVEKTSQLILEVPDVDKNREAARRHSDKLERINKKEDDIEELHPIVNDINKIVVTTAILGQILKGYYGDIRREVRQELIEKVFLSSLRFLHYIVSTLMSDPEALVSEIDKQLGEDIEGLTPEERRKITKQKLYQFLGLLSTIIIQRAALNVTSDDLKEDVAAVAQKSGTNSFRLIKSACHLIRPGALPYDELRRLSEDLKPNLFAYGVLQSLAAIHITSFHMKDADRQRLCSTAGIELLPPRASDLVCEELSGLPKA